MSIYKAENIDTDKFLEHLRDIEDLTNNAEYREKQEVIKYYEGYKKALYDIRDMFYCKNYEKSKEQKNDRFNN